MKKKTFVFVVKTLCCITIIFECARPVVQCTSIIILFPNNSIFLLWQPLREHTFKWFFSSHNYAIKCVWWLKRISSTSINTNQLRKKSKKGKGKQHPKLLEPWLQRELTMIQKRFATCTVHTYRRKGKWKTMMECTRDNLGDSFRHCDGTTKRGSEENCCQNIPLN